MQKEYLKRALTSISTLLLFLFCLIFLPACVTQMVGSAGNKENKSADFKVKLPKGFNETLTKLEVEFNNEWVAFDYHIDGCTVYYGWIRGNAIGEYKLRVCEDHQIDFICITQHGVGGNAISRLKDTEKKDKKAFFSNDRFRIPLKGKDNWGSFSVKTEGEVLGTGKMMAGSYHTNHGFFGHYKGTLYGIRLDSVKTTLTSITNQSLYQTMLNFESLKEGT